MLKNNKKVIIFGSIALVIGGVLGWFCTKNSYEKMLKLEKDKLAKCLEECNLPPGECPPSDTCPPSLPFVPKIVYICKPGAVPEAVYYFDYINDQGKLCRAYVEEHHKFFYHVDLAENLHHIDNILSFQNIETNGEIERKVVEITDDNKFACTTPSTDNSCITDYITLYTNLNEPSVGNAYRLYLNAPQSCQ